MKQRQNGFQHIFLHSGLLATLAFILALCGQAWLIPTRGYEWDLGLHETWMYRLATGNIRDFYFGGTWCDYPPGYLYVLWGAGHVYKALFPDTFLDSGTWLKGEVKLISILASFMIAGLIYHTVRKKSGSQDALWACVLYLFNPAVWMNDAVWGQSDSIPLFLMLGSVIAILSDRWILSALLIGATGLTKPQAVMAVIPVAFILFRRFSWKVWCQYAFLGGLVLLMGWLPFAGRLGLGCFSYAVQSYRTLAGEYPFTSNGAFNLWAFDGFGRPDSRTLIAISAGAWGLLFFGIALFLIIRFLSRYGSRGAPVFTFAFLVIDAAFLFWTRMHSRYICYALPFALLSCTEWPGKSWKAIYLGVSAIAFLNMAYVLYTYYGDGAYFLYSLVINVLRSKTFVLLISGIHLFIFLAAFHLYARGCCSGRR